MLETIASAIFVMIIATILVAGVAVGLSFAGIPLLTVLASFTAVGVVSLVLLRVGRE